MSGGITKCEMVWIIGIIAQRENLVPKGLGETGTIGEAERNGQPQCVGIYVCEVAEGSRHMQA